MSHRIEVKRAYYQNGRFSPQTAQVCLDENKGALFFNGYSDPFWFETLSEAEAAFDAFLADRKPADKFAIHWMEN